MDEMLIVQGLAKEYGATVRTSPCNRDGKFEFLGIKSGAYYLNSIVLVAYTGSPYAGAGSYDGMTFMQRVDVPENGNLNVDLSN